MRKFYSIVLMAAALLVGTNVKAQVATISINGATATSVMDLLASIQGIQDGQSAVINLLQPANLGENATTWDVVDLDGGKDITINLNGYDLVSRVRFNLFNASLKIQSTDSATVTEVYETLGFATYGSKDKMEPYGYCALEIGAKVIVKSDYYVLGIFPRDYRDASYTGSAIKDNGLASQTNWKKKYGAGAGVTIDIYGKVLSTKEGLSSNGQLAATVGNIPVVTIHQGATVTAGSEEAAVYGAGFVKWVVEGTIEGGVGFYAKAGQLEVNGGTIASSATQYTNPSINNNGYTGGLGCAIVADCNVNYAGDTKITITDGTIETNVAEGYAIQETKTNAQTSTTDGLIISGGTINGDLDATGELKDNIALNGTITGGEFKGDNIEEFFAGIEGYAASETASGTYVVKVSVDVTLNSAGYATFSAKKNVELPDGLVAYQATSWNGSEVFLSAVAEEAGDVLPANKGLLLKGASGANFTLAETNITNSQSVSDENFIRPATAFDAARQEGQKIFILNEGILKVYDGAQFKANRAFFCLPNANLAPARINLVFAAEDEATAIDNVETTVESVKFVENGQLFIRRGENVYNVQGQIVK